VSLIFARPIPEIDLESMNVSIVHQTIKEITLNVLGTSLALFENNNEIL
jgi:hypothetical protein